MANTYLSIENIEEAKSFNVEDKGNFEDNNLEDKGITMRSRSNGGS